MTLEPWAGYVLLGLALLGFLLFAGMVATARYNDWLESLDDRAPPRPDNDQ